MSANFDTIGSDLRTPDEKQVDILLSTYNGALYLKDQLNSLIHQSYPSWKIITRDDGSTDGTHTILREYTQRDSRLILIDDGQRHLGACQSFAYLMQLSTAPYCMFCDQDDVWFPSKIQDMLSRMHAAEKSAGARTPLLIVSDLSVTDDRQNLIAPSFWQCQRLDPSSGSRFSSLIIQNKFPGCSMMLNRPLKELCQSIPEQAIMHDWWVAMAAAAFGKIIIMPEPSMFYRQHQSNTIGLAKTGIVKTLGRSIYRIITRNPEALSNLYNLEDLNEIKACRAFRLQYADMLTKSQIAMLDSLINHSLFGILRYRIFRQPRSANINLFLVLLLLKLTHMRSLLKPVGS